MATNQGIADASSRSTADRGVSAFNLYGLRLVFLLMALFLLSTVTPLLAEPPPTMMTGVARVLLVALGLLAALGVRYPVRMLPLMMFELLWKLLWLGFIGLPLWFKGELDSGNFETFVNVAVGIPLVLIVFPYRYAFDSFVRRRGDDWGWRKRS